MNRLEKLVSVVEKSPRLQALIEDLIDHRGDGVDHLSRRDLRKMIGLPDIIEVPESLDYQTVLDSFDVINQPELTKKVLDQIVKCRKRIGGTYEVFPEHFAHKVSIDEVNSTVNRGRRNAGLPELVEYIQDHRHRAETEYKALLACEMVKLDGLEYFFAAGYEKKNSTLYVLSNVNLGHNWDVGTMFLQCKRIHP